MGRETESGAAWAGPSRRTVVWAGVGVGTAAAVGVGQDAEAATTGGGASDGVKVIPVPRQAPAAEGVVRVDGVGLGYWDTGGKGEPVVLMHPASGSRESWPYQQPVLARAGYRVIGYSRRGYHGSETGDPAQGGTGAADLHRLVQALGLGRFHIAGVAGGGGVALDYALLHPGRLRSLTIAGSSTGVEEPAYRALLNRLEHDGWDGLPEEFRELGPAYRAADPDGVARWREIHVRAVANRVRQEYELAPDWAAVEALSVPVLLFWGDADLYSPPPIQRVLASHFRRVRTVVADECGHNPQWERSDLFNPALLRFLRQNSR
ncbi:alpha/beta hydrolase [Streptomyces sp. NPDC004610]|uniref:alpha/beta fold hydrolase n=1 Tax=unclassified Streptomyces TaxID=2593676 RepID=UPI0033BE9065